MSNYLRNCWYAAAESTEISDKIFARRYLNEPVLIYRKEDGTPVALRDRCPHRYLPLSMGRKLGDTIQCGYHGMIFDETGACSDIPTQDSIPETAKIKAYPLAERYGFLWIWMGDPEKADEALIPDFEPDLGLKLGERLNDDYPSHWGYKKVQGHYQLMVDNLLDLSHIGFVHSSTIGSEETTRQHASGEQKVVGKIVSDYRIAIDVEAPPAFKAAPVEGPIDFWLDMHHHIPSNFLQVFGIAPTGMDRDKGVPFEGFHLLTPETDTSCHYYFGAYLKVKGAPQEPVDKLAMAADHAFNEDMVVIEAQQKEIIEGQELVEDTTVALRADRAGIMARKLLSQHLAAEQSAE